MIGYTFQNFSPRTFPIPSDFIPNTFSYIFLIYLLTHLLMIDIDTFCRLFPALPIVKGMRNHVQHLNQRRNPSQLIVTMQSLNTWRIWVARPRGKFTMGTKNIERTNGGRSY